MNINPIKSMPEKKQGMIFLILGAALMLLYMYGIIQKSVALAVIVISCFAILLGSYSILPSRPCPVRGRTGDPLPGNRTTSRPGRIDYPVISRL